MTGSGTSAIVGLPSAAQGAKILPGRGATFLMAGLAWNPSRLLPPLVVSVVLLVVVIGLGSVIHAGVAFLGLVLGVLLIGSLGVAVYLWVRCQRPLAGVGTLITGISIGIAFYVAPQPWIVWTVL